jgi:large subunit ribosomal protein L25
MAEEFKLDIFKRDDISKSSLKQLRRDGNIPGIFYSYNSKESIPFYMETKTLVEAKKSGARIFNIAVGSNKQTVIFKFVQYHPVTDEVLHVDLYGVDMNQAVAVKVQLKLEGNAAGVLNEGGVLVQSLNEIEIECLPSDIPKNITVDISELNLGDSFKVEELKLEESFLLKSDSEQVIASVTQAMKEEEAEPDLEEGETEGLADPETDEEVAEEQSQSEEKSNSSSKQEEK